MNEYAVVTIMDTRVPSHTLPSCPVHISYVTCYFFHANMYYKSPLLLLLLICIVLEYVLFKSLCSSIYIYNYIIICKKWICCCNFFFFYLFFFFFFFGMFKNGHASSVYVHPSSCLHAVQHDLDWVLFQEVVWTTKVKYCWRESIVINTW